MHQLLPLPDEEGIRKTKELYKNKFGQDITDEEAMDVLGRIMRFLYLTGTAGDDAKHKGDITEK